MILVAGGTGRLGTLVVRRLAAAGRPVRVLTRDPARAGHLAELPAEVVRGDVRDPRGLDAATAGATVVVSAVHGFAGPGRVTPASVDRDGNVNLIEAARRAGAAFVLTSIAGAAPGHPVELFRMKAAAEAHLLSSGVPWTIVRACAFTELYLDLLRQTAGRSGRPVVFGRGDNPVGFVPVADVAAAVTAAATDPAQRGRILHVAGAANRTMNELAAEVQGELGTGGRPPRHVPRPVLRALAATAALHESALARQAAAALLMDTTDMTFDAAGAAAQ
ncbi:SDR family oxidoreductase [Amycolatopsis thermophila]|uniref:NADH dehydrogenase n=1 Tax=Amycolatopsis thermophila TaxID=206084 RepID=A0ABU0F163_9PSEU|nr:SDR family oxidoreductase [Amycolatopsis thermophila]MDQ0381297.1 NADH dehydrogenase [Amycolatopsis thermophila]